MIRSIAYHWLMNAAVAPEVVEVAERALARAADTGWSATDLADIVEELRSLEVDAHAFLSLLQLPAPDGWAALEVGQGTRAHGTLFALRRGQSMPLHDHPSMTVICRVLFGSIRIRTLIWADRATSSARDLGEQVLGASHEPLVVQPEPGTLHAIEAIEDCAFLDLFSPYYDDDRECSYFAIATGQGSSSLVSLLRVDPEHSEGLPR